MIWRVYLFYCACVAFLRVYKWIELQILKRLEPILKYEGKQLAESIGVVLHCPGDEQWTKLDTNRVLSKCKDKYRDLVHIKIHDLMFFARVANTGTLGFAETYVEGIWDFCRTEEDISEFGKRVYENRLLDLYYHKWNIFLEWLELYVFNLQTRERVSQGVPHFEMDNDIYEIMLGSTMQYTCAYYKGVDKLDSAQIAKMDLLARKLDLKPGMVVLDIGCGWGTLCKYLAENYKVKCVGISIAEQGINYGKKICKDLPVELRVQDYREVNQKFDRIVCVEMLEHTGVHTYPEFFQMVDRCLTKDGIFVLHTTGLQLNNIHARSEPFCHKYIFPNGHFPKIEDIVEATNKLFVVEDWQNIGLDYAKTFYDWRINILNGWPQLEREQDDDQFYRMLIVYLSSARAIYSSRTAQVWQIVFSKKGLKRGYMAIR